MIPFHLAFPVTDLEKTRQFYVELLECPVGREAERWLDMDFFGHQITAHLVNDIGGCSTNDVDGDAVPARHFGAVLGWKEWEQLVQKLKNSGIPFLIGPTIRFKDKPGEQGTFFVRDPSGNALEFKTFRDPKMLFEK